MTENKAIERIKYRMYTVGQVAGEGGMEDLKMAVKALEEIQQYRAIEKELKERYHANVDIPLLMHHFIETVFEGEKHEGFCLLTNEEAKAWDEYKSIGTPEECRAAMEKQKEMIAYCNENDCSDCYCNNGNWKETNRCMNDFIAEEIGQVAEIKWGDEE